MFTALVPRIVPEISEEHKVIDLTLLPDQISSRFLLFVKEGHKILDIKNNVVRTVTKKIYDDKSDIIRPFLTKTYLIGIDNNNWYSHINGTGLDWSAILYPMEICIDTSDPFFKSLNSNYLDIDCMTKNILNIYTLANSSYTPHLYDFEKEILKIKELLNIKDVLE